VCTRTVGHPKHATGEYDQTAGAMEPMQTVVVSIFILLFAPSFAALDMLKRLRLIIPLSPCSRITMSSTYLQRTNHFITTNPDTNHPIELLYSIMASEVNEFE
jgi:hypothetical protein